MATVTDIINDSRAYAESWTGQADNFLAQLESIAATNINVGNITTYSSFAQDKTQEALDQVRGAKPGRPTVPSINAPVPPAPVLVDVQDAELPTIPDFTKNAPELSFPARPDASVPGAPGQPDITLPTIPDEPANLESEINRVLGELARLQVDTVVPEPPNVEIPIFSASAPLDNLVEPTNTFSFFEDYYSSTLLDATKAKLLTDLEQGGYGIEPNDEQQLWERARDREAQASRVRVEEVDRQITSRNFPMPGGTYQLALDAAAAQGQGEVSDLNRDIALRRSELYVQNRQFTLSQSTAVENVLIGYHASVMERRLNAARLTLQAAIDVFDASVRAFNARLQNYQVEAQVYEALLRGVQSKLEIWRTEIEGKRLELAVTEAATQVLIGSTQALTQLTNLHRVRMEAASIEADIQRQRLEGYRATVQGYEATVRAKATEFEIYNAEIRGEQTRMDAYATEVQAYRQQVEAASVESSTRVANVRSQLDNRRLELEDYRAKIQQFEADLNAQVEQVRRTIDLYRADIGVYGSEVSAIARAFDVGISADQVNVSNAAQLNRGNLEQARIRLRELVSSTDLRRVGSEGGLRTYGDLINGALSALNTLASQIATE